MPGAGHVLEGGPREPLPDLVVGVARQEVRVGAADELGPTVERTPLLAARKVDNDVFEALLGQEADIRLPLVVAGDVVMLPRLYESLVDKIN